MIPEALWHRLRSTHAREWPHRAREQVRQWRDRRRVAVNPSADLPTALLRSPAPAWPIPERCLLDPECARALGASVDAILADEVVLLGHRYPSAAAWDVDPATGTTWDRETPGVGVDLHAGDRDIKLAWELHRLQHLQILAIGSRVLERPEAAERCNALLVDWLTDQRPYLGIAWSSGLEVASRVMSQLIVAGCLGPLDPALNAALWHSLTAHARWMVRFPSLHSSANNHRVGEVAALAILGALSRNHPDAGQWLLHGRELEVRLADLIHPDGVPAEQSPTYGAYSLEWALFARHALAGAGLRLAVEDRLVAAAHFLADLVDRGGHWPRFGDDDEGVVVRSQLEPEALPISVGACLSSALGVAGATPVAARQDVRAGLLGLTITADPPPEGIRHYADGGYTVWRAADGERESLVLFDHGPLGHGATCGHGHADALSVWWHVDGQPVLVDTGTYRYNGAPAWRRHARGTAAHNTVIVDGHDQSEQLSGFTWGRRARAGRLPDRDDGIRASHDGYDGLDCRHERRVQVEGSGALIVQDRVHGAESHLVHGAWHVDPAVTVEVTDPDRARLQLPGGAVLDVLVEGGRLRAVVGDGEPGPGTISPGYNQAIGTTTLLIDPDHARRWTTRFERAP